MSAPRRGPQIAIVGAGAGGLCAAIRLKESGFCDLTILERADGVGGTWYHNRYPGCECDIPSHLYSFSFEPKADWSKPYGTQAEILSYLEDVARKHDLLASCRFGTTVEKIRWDDGASQWRIETDAGDTVVADIVISAIGMFNELAFPDIDGIDRFRGTSFHTARWNWDHDLSGERVAVIGSAASAVQAVPEIVKTAGQVHLFQRTANWVMPKQDEPFADELLEAFRKDPSLVALARNEIFDAVDGGLTFSDAERVAEMENSVLEAMQQVDDPEVRAQLVPNHPFGCKRPLLSNDFYPAFNRENLELVTEPIERLTEHSIVTADGAEREIDTLVFATGFEATRYLSALDVRGRGGVRIEDAWNDGAMAYKGITTAGFPNLFMIYGPNTNNGSLITMIEYQAEYIAKQVQRLVDDRLAWMDVRPEAMRQYNDELQKTMQGVKAWQAGCNGYYRSPSGRIVTQWPDSMTAYRDTTNAPDADAYETAKRP